MASRSVCQSYYSARELGRIYPTIAAVVITSMAFLALSSVVAAILFVKEETFTHDLMMFGDNYCKIGSRER